MEKKTSSTSVAFKWALISFIVGVVLTYVFQFINIGLNSPVRWIAYIFFIGFLLLTQKEFRDQLGGYISFGDAFVAGLLYSVFSGILTAIFIYIYYSFLSPQVYQQVLDAQRATLEARNMSSDQIDGQMQIMTKFGPLITLFAVAIVTPIMGAIIALIGAAIFKKVPTIIDLENNEA